MQNIRILLSIQDFIYHCATGACTNSTGQAFLTYAHDPEESKYDLEIYPNHIMDSGGWPYPPAAQRTHVAWEPKVQTPKESNLPKAPVKLHATCSWGVAADVILYNEDKSIDLDLTAEEANILGAELILAAKRSQELEKGAQEYFTAKEKT